MPTNKQRREAARRHLERQLQRRIESDAKRKRRNLILTIVGSLVVIGVITVAMVALIHDDKKSSASADSTPSPSASTQAVGPKTDGPCGYAQTAATAVKNVGVPPDPSPTPTIDRVMTLVTSGGTVTVALDGAVAPCTVQSMAYLAGKGYYNATTCHRLVASSIFVLQCGDPSGTGSGGPGYSIKDEGLDKADYSVVGTVAMANAGTNTNGSQFFIVFKDSSVLPKNYTPIGHVTAGMDVIQTIAAAGTDNSNGTGDGGPNMALNFITVTVAPPVDGSGTLVTPSATAPASSSAATPTSASTPAVSSSAP